MTHDPTKSLGERLLAASREAQGFAPDVDASRFGKLDPTAQAYWNRAAVNFTARLSDAPTSLPEIRNALRVALARFEAESDRYQERQGVNSEDLSEVIDTVRSALKVAEKLP